MTKNETKTLIITGASQGIGQAIAFRFAADGFNIVIVSKDSPVQIQETIGGIESAGGKALSLSFDVQNSYELREIVTETIANFGSYVVEMGLKKKICETLDWDEYPPKNSKDFSKFYKTHDQSLSLSIMFFQTNSTRFIM